MGVSIPLSISTDVAVSDALLPFRPLRIFVKLATSLLIYFSLPRNKWRVSLNSPTTCWMLDSLFAWCFSWTEKIIFFHKYGLRIEPIRLQDSLPCPLKKKNKYNRWSKSKHSGIRSGGKFQKGVLLHRPTTETCQRLSSVFHFNQCK